MEFQNIKLTRAKLPNMGAGTYTIHVEQSVHEPAEKTLPSADSVFHVGGRRFGMEQGIIHSVYPPADSSGCYKDTLPHIVFSQASFPWIRRLYSGQKEDTMPFVALISLSEGEEFEEGRMTIEQLVNFDDPEIYFPKYDITGTTGEAPEDICDYVDISCELLEDIMPREDELEYLAHVRTASLYDKSDSLISQDGNFSVIVCNRFPESPQGKSCLNYVFLVSLENYHGFLPEGDGFAEVAVRKKARFLVLHQWSFDSTVGDEPGFCHVMENLDAGTLSLPKTAEKNEAAEITERGYVPLMHITRTGEKTISFYRSPLTPYETEWREHRECRTADGEIRYDPKYGIFDMTYAAAWQIGRFLALSDREAARQIYLWRREVIMQLHRSYARLQICERFQGYFAVQKAETLQESFLKYLVRPDSVLGQFKRIANMGDSSGLWRDGMEWMKEEWNEFK